VGHLGTIDAVAVLTSNSETDSEPEVRPVTCAACLHAVPNRNTMPPTLLYYEPPLLGVAPGRSAVEPTVDVGGVARPIYI